MTRTPLVNRRWLPWATTPVIVLVIVGEYLGGDRGLGRYAVNLQNSLQIPQLYGAIVAAFLGGILEALEFTADKKNFDKVVAAVHRYNKDITPEKLKIRLPLEIERRQAAGPDKLLQIDPAAWNAGITNLNKAGLIKNRPAVEKLTDTNPLQKAKNG